MKSDVNKLGLECKWQDLTEGMQIYGESTSLAFHTGEWTSVKPQLNESLCVHCLMCVPVCPDSVIPVIDGKRGLRYLCKSVPYRRDHHERSEVRWQGKTD